MASENEQLNDDLLRATVDENDVQEAEQTQPRRNTKDDLISKIINCCADNNLELQHSNTKLRRMTKDQLCKVLAEKIELGVKSQMAAQVGAKPGASDGVIALGALKMVHNICAATTERGLNTFLPRYGYEVSGFCNSLKDPAVDEAVTQCLLEIAAESDVMKHIESPYVRLAIAWGGALVSSVRKAPQILKPRHASHMEPRQTRAKNPVQPRLHRRPPPRQEHRVQPLSSDDEK
jgi:hypothetical protein